MPDNPHNPSPDAEPPVLFQILASRRPLEGEQAFRGWLAELSRSLTGKRVAAAARIAPPHLSGLIHGRAPIGAQMAARFGFRRVVRVEYVPIEEDKEQERGERDQRTENPEGPNS